MKPTSRVLSLDYLRGLAALGIMVYHYQFWLEGIFTSGQFLGRVGVYGVSVFYVLSGLTLFHVYETSDRMKSFNLRDFIRKRALRIYPLLWLATVSAIVLSLRIPNWNHVFLNLSGLFGFIKWDTTFATGAWSIGNELVFYSIFPLVIYTSSKRPILFILLLIASGSLHHYFAFQTLNAHVELVHQWHSYVNPLNQVFFFMAGCSIAYFTKNRDLSRPICLAILGLGLGLFILTPAEGNTIALVTGINRWIFTGASILICLGVYKIATQMQGIAGNFFQLLGESSYSLYLLHPLVFTVWAFVFKRLEGLGWQLSWMVKFTVPCLISLALSYVVYTYFERYFMRMGRHSSPGSPS
jgi:exopolysaccharide production protein ExoZ